MNLFGRKVIVHDDVEKAIRKFKKKINDDGILQDLQSKQFYVPSTVKKKIAKSQAKKRWKRYLESQKLPPKLF